MFAVRVTKMKMLWLVVTVTFFPIGGLCPDQAGATTDTNSIVFRQPFTLKLHVDKEHYYEGKFGKIPYVHKDDVYLFEGETFGIDLDITNGLIRGIAYEPETNKAAVILRFTQDVKDDGDAMMLLVIDNHTQHKLFIDALMTVPGNKRPQKTSILPVEAGLGGYEAWPHPIVQLVLRNIRLAEKVSTEGTTPEPLPTGGGHQLSATTNANLQSEIPTNGESR